jgi:sensor histidine kinase YesM
LNWTHKIQTAARNRILQHLLFWAMAFYVLARIFSYSDEIGQVEVIYTFLFMFSLLLAVYPNLLWLIPRFLSTGQYGSYFFLLALNAVAAAGLNLLTFNHLSDIIFPGYYFITYYNFWDIMQFVGVFIIVSSLIKLSKGWFQNLEIQRRLHQLEREKSDAELHALKAQINPHFLFNSLNNLYSLALEGDAQTPDILLRLSDMMRYQLYETNVSRVSLGKELEHLRNFMEMQKLRVGEQVNIAFELSGDTSELEVAPLLFLPLVENGFKHGVKGETKGAFITVSCHLNARHLMFKVENNKGQVDEVERGGFNGVGLQNLRRRLDLIYPGKYELTITDGIKVFTAILKLDLT